LTTSGGTVGEFLRREKILLLRKNISERKSLSFLEQRKNHFKVYST
jgi:hypothetical protein